MLVILTVTTDLVAMAVTLWMAFYLFARGFPNLLTMKAALSLLAVAVFFLGTFNNFFVQTTGTATLRAVLLVIAMTCWYSVTFHLFSEINRKRFQWMEIGVYTLSLICIVLLLATKAAFLREQGNNLYVAQMERSLVYSVYGATQAILALGLLFNLLMEERIRFTVQGRYFLFATIFPVLGVVYGIFSLIVTGPPMLRLIQDALVFGGVFMLGISVALHQNLVERRVILQDFPVEGGTMLALVLLYILIGTFLGVEQKFVGLLVAFIIFSHSIYDLSREFLERRRIRDDTNFRRKIRLIEHENAGEKKFQMYLQQGLDHLCEMLDTSAGIIAVHRDGKTVVMAGRNSVEVGSEISVSMNGSEDVFHPAEKIKNIEWATFAFEGPNQVALVGMGASNVKLNYSTGDLDLFTEFADHVGILASIGISQPTVNVQVQMAEEEQSHEDGLELAAGMMMETLSSNVDAGFVKMVEDALRKFSDFIMLGQSSLAEWIHVKGDSHIERGKKVQGILRQGVETLRPAESRPPEPLPRVWYNYVVLHDAYINGVINREVMARLYISEGTFNRTRRNALRGVARWLLEENKAGKI